MSTPAFRHIFRSIQELKAEHAAQERRNEEALRKAKEEIEAILNTRTTTDDSAEKSKLKP